MLFWQLKVFHAIVQDGGFTRAGESLRLSQPAVSSNVKRLEKELGVELFSRFGTRVQLTDAGRIVERYASGLLTTIETMKSEIDELRGLPTGHLFCAAGTTIGVYILPKILVDFKKRFPKTEARLFIARTAEAERKVLANEVDLGLVAGRVKNTAHLRIFPFFNDEMVIVAPPGHPITEHSTITPKRLKDFPLILPEKGAPNRILIESSLQKAGISYRYGMELGGTEAIKRAVYQGLGIAIVSLAALEWELQTKFLIPVRISGHQMKREYKVIIHKGKRISSPMKTFLELLGLQKIP